MPAGCDQFDSDNDGTIDNCEDRYPPQLLLENTDKFMCNKAALEDLCYKGEVFQQNSHAEEWLKVNFGVVDDCTPSRFLGIDVAKVDDEQCSQVKFGE